MANLLTDIGGAFSTANKDLKNLYNKIPKSLAKPIPSAGTAIDSATKKIGKATSAATQAANVYESLKGLNAADIYNGKIDLSAIPYAIDTGDAVFKSLPVDIQNAVKFVKGQQLQQLQQNYGNQNSGVGAGVANPMAVQMMYQNLIQPFLNQSNQQAQGQISGYQNMMNQVLQDQSIPQVYRSTLAAQVPGQVENLQNQLYSNQQAAMASPEQASLQNLLTQLIQEQQARQRYDVMYGTGPASNLSSQINQFSLPLTAPK